MISGAIFEPEGHEIGIIDGSGVMAGVASVGICAFQIKEPFGWAEQSQDDNDISPSGKDIYFLALSVQCIPFHPSTSPPLQRLLLATRTLYSGSSARAQHITP